MSKDLLLWLGAANLLLAIPDEDGRPLLITGGMIALLTYWLVA